MKGRPAKLNVKKEKKERRSEGLVTRGTGRLRGVVHATPIVRCGGEKPYGSRLREKTERIMNVRSIA